jgi:hypothetical protein
MTTQSHPTSPGTDVVSELRALFDGRAIVPEDEAYDAARAVFYGSRNRRPAAVVRAKDADDVSRVVTLAREKGLELAVKSGGHSLAGHSVSEDGIVLDLSWMKGIEVDVEARTAWAETGLTAAEYTSAVGAHGLATGFGDTGSVGIGGITLGGGAGFLVRKHGLTIDSLLAAEIVSADGELLRVDAETRPDLFWAIRGGGGNFGVATRFKFRLHGVAEFVGGMLVLPATPDTIASFVAEAEAAPEELSTIANVMVAPPMPFFPAAAHGKLVIFAFLAYSGEIEAGESAIAPFRSLAEPIADTVRPMRYPEMYGPDEPGPDEEVARSLFIDTVDVDVAAAIVEHLRASTAMMAVAQLRVLGGAMARVPDEATAFAHRKRRIMVALGAVFGNREEETAHREWVEDFAAALYQGEPGVYVGFLGDEGEERVKEAYPGTTWERLKAIKARYDPENLFSLNQNIAPETGPS